MVANLMRPIPIQSNSRSIIVCEAASGHKILGCSCVAYEGSGEERASFRQSFWCQCEKDKLAKKLLTETFPQSEVAVELEVEQI
jgi:hypothetical protein